MPRLLMFDGDELWRELELTFDDEPDCA